MVTLDPAVVQFSRRVLSHLSEQLRTVVRVKATYITRLPLSRVTTNLAIILSVQSVLTPAFAEINFRRRIVKFSRECYVHLGVGGCYLLSAVITSVHRIVCYMVYSYVTPALRIIHCGHRSIP